MTDLKVCGRNKKSSPMKTFILIQLTGRIPGSTGPMSDFLCRYCLKYHPSRSALNVHVNIKYGRTPCSKKHTPKGKANFFDWLMCEYDCPVDGCYSAAKTEQSIKNHMNTHHGISFKQDEKWKMWVFERNVKLTPDLIKIRDNEPNNVSNSEEEENQASSGNDALPMNGKNQHKKGFDKKHLPKKGT